MKIINYNKINHDIYTFDESAMVLCALPSSANESIPGVRRHATITGWNTAGLWNNNIDGSGVPDWSGLSARSRGSNLYGAPRQNLIPTLVPEFNGVPGSNNPEFSNITNWNNGIPVYIIISKKHFIACAHFVGIPNFTPQSFDILDKDGVMHSISGEFVSREGDTNLYRITSITGGSLPPATEINPTHKIKIYQILNLFSFGEVLEGLRIWYQVNNGMFVTTTKINNYITYANAAQGQPTAPSAASGLPIIYALQQVWVGDSGTPMLATYNGETYLIGMSNGGHMDYSHPGVLPWLRSNLLADGITITLFDPVPIPTFSCNTNTGDCISDPNGTWVNKSDCDTACNALPPDPKYTCNEYGECIQSDTGVSLSECIASCGIVSNNDILIYLDTIPNPTEDWIAKFKALGVKFQGVIYQNEGNDFENFLPGTNTLGNNSMINPINSAEIISRLNADTDNPGGKPLLIQDPYFYDAIGLNFESRIAGNLILGNPNTQTEIINLLTDMKTEWTSGPLANKNWSFGLDLNGFHTSSQLYVYGFCKQGNPFSTSPSGCIPPQSTFGEGLATVESGYSRAEPILWELSDARINEISDFIIERDTSMGLVSDIIITYCFPIYSENNFSTNGSSVPQANIWTDTVAPEDMKSFHWGSKLTRKFTNILNSTDSGNRKALAQISASGWYLNNISKNSILQIANEVIDNDIGIFLWTNFGGDQSRMQYSYNRSGALYDACRPDIGLDRNVSGELTTYGQTQVAYRKMFARAFYGATPGNENISDVFWKSDIRYAELTEKATKWLYELCVDIRQINVIQSLNKYSCNPSTHTCYQDPEGIWNDLILCNNYCNTTPDVDRVDCIDSQCITTNPNGRYADIAECVASSNCIPIVPPTKYSCNPITTKCDEDVDGSWDDKEACEIFCSNITPINRVDCINNVCTETNPDGRYVNVEECLSGAACSPIVPPTTTYDCINKQCVAITTGSPGPFISVDICIANCIDTSPSSWDCVNNTCIEFIDDPSHQYSTFERCSQNCSVIPPTVTYDCIDGTCRPVYGDPAGTYPDLLSCTLACRVREINTWECIDSRCQEITGPSGRYTTEEQCLGSDCGSEVPVTTYNCVSGVCVAIDGPDGTYRTQSDCINRGCGIIISPPPPNITNTILENPQFIDVTKSIPTTPLSGYPYNSR